MARRIKDLSAPERDALGNEYLWNADICKGYCLLALRKAGLTDPHQTLEIMDALENELCSGASVEDALRELSDWEFALNDWHC